MFKKYLKSIGNSSSLNIDSDLKSAKNSSNMTLNVPQKN